MNYLLKIEDLETSIMYFALLRDEFPSYTKHYAGASYQYPYIMFDSERKDICGSKGLGQYTIIRTFKEFRQIIYENRT